MLKTYEQYLIKNFLNKFLIISLIFLSLIVILSILEEISFFKDIDINFLYPYFLTLLSSPITLFEIFPFIFYHLSLTLNVIFLITLEEYIVICKLSKNTLLNRLGLRLITKKDYLYHET